MMREIQLYGCPWACLRTDLACDLSSDVIGSSSVLCSVAQDVVQLQAIRPGEEATMLSDWPEDFAAPSRRIGLYSKRSRQHWRASRLCE